MYIDAQTYKYYLLSLFSVVGMILGMTMQITS